VHHASKSTIDTNASIIDVNLSIVNTTQW